MNKTVTKREAQKWLGKSITAYKKDGSIVTGKLVKISGNRLIVRQSSGKKVKTKAIIPLVLFDLLAIGTAPYGYGYGGGYGGGYGYGGYPYGYGYPPYGGFW
ncbi:hypothetical protein SAMN04488542_11870 [Fontibacillus panacisegetis]|uniref:50S ribosomal protein L33 n=1 Tax=Fontibacillus panacisegetis TaxID=670482 RepID=A0A1G7PEM7_9BACL|nr:hypothetical protein [Fontibacillus panacisegetis]SDF84681.1 hypothetical protein SAMN04488542_11870 [Fontibacillus panacisegetis]